MDPKAWSEEENNKLRDMFNTDTPRNDIAKALNRSYASVVSRLHALGITSKESRRRQLSKTQRSVWNRLTNQERRDRIKPPSRINRGIAYPPKYEKLRKYYMRGQGMKAKEADEAVRAAMKEDGAN